MERKKVKIIGIVSLSAGTLGESFVQHELKIGLSRLEKMGIRVKFLPHALSGRAYVEAHPAERAQDLLDAFEDDEIDMILCAIGGEDTYRLLPYLFENDELKKAVRRKIFLGFSDSTINHLMLHKVGLPTFYGQSFLSDVCDIGPDMMPYTKLYFDELVNTCRIKTVKPSPVWYDARTDFSEASVGTVPASHRDSGFELLQGASIFNGKILGGCIDSIFDLFDNSRFPDTVTLCGKYHLFPSADEWRGKILLLESSEELMPPEKYERALIHLKEAGVFEAVTGVLIGKPMNEVHFEEYKTILQKVIANPDLPVVVNVNIGHATPRCIIPFGVPATVDANRQEISFHYGN